MYDVTTQRNELFFGHFEDILCLHIFQIYRVVQKAVPVPHKCTPILTIFDCYNKKCTAIGQMSVGRPSGKVIVNRPLSTVGYTSVAASVIHSRQWSN